MNAAMANFLPCAHQRDEEKVPCKMTKKRERREVRERERYHREGEMKEKKEWWKKFSHL